MIFFKITFIVKSVRGDILKNNMHGGGQMKLEEIAEFTMGAFTNRLETLLTDDSTVVLNLLSLKEFNETLGISYRISSTKKLKLRVLKSKVDPDFLTDSQNLILHTQAQKVTLLPEKYSGLLLTNNFMKIKLSKEVDVAFFEWYFNEHPDVQKQLAFLGEGSAVPLLKLSHLKDLEVNLPSLEKQKIIGRIAQLKRYREILQTERMDLQRQFIQQQLIQIIEKN